MAGPSDPYIPLGRSPDFLGSKLPNNLIISQYGSDSEDRQMSSIKPTAQAFDFLPARYAGMAACDAQAIDPAEDFLLDFDADAAIAACEALWNT